MMDLATIDILMRTLAMHSAIFLLTMTLDIIMLMIMTPRRPIPIVQTVTIMVIIAHALSGADMEKGRRGRRSRKPDIMSHMGACHDFVVTVLTR